MALINTFFLQNSVCKANGARNMLKFSKLFCGFNYLIQICTRSQGNKFVADFKYMLMQTALENLIEYVENTFNDDELNDYIEMTNFVAGNIYKINKRINVIEQEQITFGNISIALELELIKLKQSLTQEINKL